MQKFKSTTAVGKRKFIVTAPIGNLKFVMESDSAETALRNLKAYLLAIDPQVSTEGEFLVSHFEGELFVPPATGIFAGIYENIIAQNIALTIERDKLSPNQLN